MQMLGMFYDGGYNAENMLIGVFTDYTAIDKWLNDAKPTYIGKELKRYGDSVRTDSWDVFSIESIEINVAISVVDNH
jgi:hypothetical protein